MPPQRDISIVWTATAQAWSKLFTHTQWTLYQRGFGALNPSPCSQIFTFILMGSQSSLLLIHFHDSPVLVPNKTKKSEYFFVVIFYPIRGLCCTVLLLFSQWWEDSVLLSRSNRTASRSEYATCIRAFSPALFNLYIYVLPEWGWNWTQVSLQN